MSNKENKILKPVGTPIIAPIGKGKGIKLPPLHANGNLTVENDNNIIKDEKRNTDTIEESVQTLPEIDTKFSIGNQKYKVCYINVGKGRFSAEPY